MSRFLTFILLIWDSAMSARSSASSNSCCTFLSLVRWALACSSCQKPNKWFSKHHPFSSQRTFENESPHSLFGLPLVHFDFQLEFVHELLQPHRGFLVLLGLVDEKRRRIRGRLSCNQLNFSGSSYLIRELFNPAIKLAHTFHRLRPVLLFCFKLILQFPHLQ